MFQSCKKAMVLSLLFSVLRIVSYAQAPTVVPANADELRFFRQLLITIADPSHDPQMLKMNEDGLATLYGLNQQEAAIIHSAGQTYGSAIQTFRAKRAAITAGKAKLSSQDLVAMAGISSDLDQAIANISNQILSSVRPERANLLRLQGHLVADAIAGTISNTSNGSK